MLVTDVFKTKGVPTHTYVSVTDGKYEKALANYIRSRGTLCLITGPSKTGKSTLVCKVAQTLGLVAVKVRCDEKLQPTEFWRKALEKLDFARIRETTHAQSTETEIGATVEGKLGWKWLASLLGGFSASFTRERCEEDIREKILASPCAEHLIPLLKRTNTLLIVEDFHYLTPACQKIIFQEWKAFVDEEVSVVVIGTTHHACDLAQANRDLTGRIGHIGLSTWLKSDLRQIVTKGLVELNMEMDKRSTDIIAEESAGLPILTQSICLHVLQEQGIQRRSFVKREIALSRRQLYRLLHQVVDHHYKDFAAIYQRLIKGLRRDGRQFRTYEFLLSVFSLDPIRFDLSRDDILARFESLPLPKAELPPVASIDNALSHIGKLQRKIDVRLLEWVKIDETMYITEPSFLFYLRWMKQRRTVPDIYDMIAELLPDTVRLERGTGRQKQITKLTFLKQQYQRLNSKDTEHQAPANRVPGD